MSDHQVRTSAATGDDLEATWSSLVPSPETREFLGTVRPQLATVFPLPKLRALLDGAEPDLAGWSILVDSGYTSIGLPEELGGFGTVVDLVALLEEAGRGLLPVPLLATTASAQTLLAAGSTDDALAALPASLVVARGKEAWLSVFDGRLIEQLTVVRADRTGVTVTRLALAGSPHGTGKDPVDPSRALGAVDTNRAEELEQLHLAGTTVDHVVAVARCCVAADLLGVAQLALDGAIAHVLVREQFGRPIGSFQAVKHMLVDVDVAIERARSLTLGAASACAGEPLGDTARRLAMLAKASAAEAATHAAAVHVQLLGAMGLTFEADAPLVVRRAQQTARFLGIAPDLYARAASDFVAEGPARV